MAEQPTAVNTAGHPIHTIPHQHQHQHQQHQKQQTQHEEALAPGRIGGFIFGKNMWFDTSDMLLWGGNAILGMALIGVWGSGIPALRGLGAPFTRTAKDKVTAIFGSSGASKGQGAAMQGILDRHVARCAATPTPTAAMAAASVSSAGAGAGAGAGAAAEVATYADAADAAAANKDAIAARGAQTLVDLGSGDGVLMRAACRAGFGNVIGYEKNPMFHYIGKALSGFSAQYNAADFRRGDLFEADLSAVDVVTVYGYPPIMDKLEHKLREELPDGAICVSNAYPFEGWTPIEVIGVNTSSLSPDASSDIFVYQVCQEAECEGNKS